MCNPLRLSAHIFSSSFVWFHFYPYVHWHYFNGPFSGRLIIPLAHLLSHLKISSVTGLENNRKIVQPAALVTKTTKRRNNWLLGFSLFLGLPSKYSNRHPKIYHLFEITSWVVTEFFSKSIMCSDYNLRTKRFSFFLQVFLYFKKYTGNNIFIHVQYKNVKCYRSI